MLQLRELTPEGVFEDRDRDRSIAERLLATTLTDSGTLSCCTNALRTE